MKVHRNEPVQTMKYVTSAGELDITEDIVNIAMLTVIPVKVEVVLMKVNMTNDFFGLMPRLDTCRQSNKYDMIWSICAQCPNLTVDKLEIDSPLIGQVGFIHSQNTPASMKVLVLDEILEFI